LIKIALVALASVCAVLLTGCSGPKEITDADQRAAEKQYSQENYEKAMAANGHAADLAKAKAVDAARGGGAQGDR